ESRVRSYTSVSTYPFASGNQTGRRPLIGDSPRRARPWRTTSLPATGARTATRMLMNSTGTSGGVSENFSRYAASKAWVSARRTAWASRPSDGPSGGSTPRSTPWPRKRPSASRWKRAVSSLRPVSPMTARASSSRVRNAISSAVRSPRSSRIPTVATRSTRAGATSRPSAEATPADGGQITRLRPSLCATWQAGPGAAGAEERVVARIAAALGDVHAGGARHALVDDVVDAPRDRDQRQAHRAGEPGQGRARRVDVDRDGAAGEVVRVQVAQEEIGV